MYVKANVLKPGTNAGVGGDKKDLIAVFDWDEVLSYSRTNNNAGVAHIVMNQGKYMILLYCTISTIKGGFTTEGEEDAEGFMHEVSGEHPGDSLEILEFIQNNIGKNLGVIVQKCSDAKKKQYGTPCAPLKLSIASTDDKDKNIQALTFKASQKSKFIAGLYEGTLTLAEPVDEVAHDATNIDLSTGEGNYQIDSSSSGTVIATISNPTNGMRFTVLGGGGASPSKIESGGAFILSNGTAWTGLAGSGITFRVFKDGASTYKAIEVARF